MVINQTILKKIDWNLLNTYIDNNLIIANKHPEYNIWILNYSPKTKFKKFWDTYTTSCHGLVIDDNGNILARPFKKIINYDEYNSAEIDLSQNYEIFEKIDGTFILLFYYELYMQWIFASRNSFVSEQAIEAQKMINSKNINLNRLDKQYTYIFEIIYKKNRIVVDYGDRYELVVLAIIETSSGVEIDYNDLLSIYSKYFTIVKKFNIKINNLNDLKKLEEENNEGFVVKFSNNYRINVKFVGYVKLYGILSNVSNIIVWEHLMNNYDFNMLLDRVPDEFYDWLTSVIRTLQSQYNEIEHTILKEFVRIYYINNIGINNDRKSFAVEAIKSKYWLILFKMYNKQSYGNLIWKEIKPKFCKPFKNEHPNMDQMIIN